LTDLLLTTVRIRRREGLWISEFKDIVYAFYDRHSNLNSGLRYLPWDEALDRADVQALILAQENHGSDPKYLAVEPIYKFSGKEAYEVAARMCWMPGMKKCKLKSCPWTKRGIKHASQLAQEDVQDAMEASDSDSESGSQRSEESESELSDLSER
jgi:hypothetical protein